MAFYQLKGLSVQIGGNVMKLGWGLIGAGLPIALTIFGSTYTAINWMSNKELQIQTLEKQIISLQSATKMNGDSISETKDIQTKSLAEFNGRVSGETSRFDARLISLREALELASRSLSESKNVVDGNTERSGENKSWVRANEQAIEKLTRSVEDQKWELKDMLRKLDGEY